MIITPSLFEAFLKCPTKCWLRANGETPTGNPYAEWVQSQSESFRATEAERLLAEAPPGESARSPSPENLKASQWRLAVNVAVQTPPKPCSSRREAAPSAFAQSSTLHAIERVPSGGHHTWTNKRDMSPTAHTAGSGGK